MTASLRNSITVAALMAMLAAAAAYAAPPNVAVDTKVDRSDVTVGDVIKYTISAKHNPSVKINIPSISEKLGEFFVRNISTPKPRKQGDLIVDEVTYDITTYFTGDMKVPAVDISYTYKGDDGKEKTETITTEPLEIKVHPVSPENATDIKDIKGPVDVPVGWRFYALWGGLAFAVLAAAVLTILYFTRWRKRAEDKALQAPPRPAHEVALERLKAIEEMDLVAEGKFKEYYDMVTGVLREYLGSRYTIDAMEMTSSELLRGLAGSLKDLDLRSRVASVLEEGDMVKFAKHLPDEDRARLALTETRTVVERTIPWVFKQAQAAQPAAGEEPEP